MIICMFIVLYMIIYIVYCIIIYILFMIPIIFLFICMFYIFQILALYWKQWMIWLLGLYITVVLIQLLPIPHCSYRDIASLSLFYRYSYLQSSEELLIFIPSPLVSGYVTRGMGLVHTHLLAIPTWGTSPFKNSLLPRLLQLLISSGDSLLVYRELVLWQLFQSQIDFFL